MEVTPVQTPTLDDLLTLEFKNKLLTAEEVRKFFLHIAKPLRCEVYFRRDTAERIGDKYEISRPDESAPAQVIGEFISGTISRERSVEYACHEAHPLDADSPAPRSRYNTLQFQIGPVSHFKELHPEAQQLIREVHAAARTYFAK
jgi:hypothetical protein